jgi:Reverse transcriptase (RNA-dependent DNA polymerase)
MADLGSDEGGTRLGSLEPVEPGWFETEWTEVAGLQPSGAVQERAQLAQDDGLISPRKLHKIDVLWEEVQVALEECLGNATLLEGPQLQTKSDTLAQEWGKALRDDQFVAGVTNRRVAAWRQYFQWAEGEQALTPEQETLLTWLRHGVKIDWVGVDSQSQVKHPRFAIRKKQVGELLHSTLPGQEQRVKELLRGNKPGSISFPNRKSVSLNQEFVKSALDDLLLTGALRQVTEDQVQVCNGLGVVANRHGKLRLILDARYINLFDKYVSFSYEQLSDLPQYARAGDWLTLTDFKSGYHHFKVHPSDQKYLGLSFMGKFYVFTVLPFGLSSACRTYTRFMQQVYQPLRQRGLRLTTFIDDAIFLAYSYNQGVLQMKALLLLLTWLGFCLSRSKCLSLPEQQGQFLGLVVDLQRQAFQVPKAKAEYILAKVKEVRAGGCTKRDFAKLAGMLVSISPAVRLAPLYTRRLFLAMGETRDWEDNISEELVDLTEEDLSFWEKALQEGRGKPWRQEGKVFTCYGDASARGYGGFSDELLIQPMQESFSVEEQELMAKGDLSSCHREVKNICLLVRTCIRANEQKLQGAVLLVFCDNQGAVANVNSMNGRPQTLRELRLMFEAAEEVGVDIRAQWVPRET